MLKKEMCEYEILKESIGKCTDEGQMERAIIEAELDDPEAYVKMNDNWPLYDILTNSDGDLVILTKSGEGNIRKYTFMKC